MTALIPAKPPGAFLRHIGSLSGAESQENTQTHPGKWTGGRHVNERTGGTVRREGKGPNVQTSYFDYSSTTE